MINFLGKKKYYIFFIPFLLIALASIPDYKMKEYIISGIFYCSTLCIVIYTMLVHSTEYELEKKSIVNRYEVQSISRKHNSLSNLLNISVFFEVVMIIALLIIYKNKINYIYASFIAASIVYSYSVITILDNLQLFLIKKYNDKVKFFCSKKSQIIIFYNIIVLNLIGLLFQIMKYETLIMFYLTFIITPGILIFNTAWTLKKDFELYLSTNKIIEEVKD